MDDEYDYSRYRDELRLFCYRMSGSLSLAEVLSEEALLAADGQMPPRERDRGSLYGLAAGSCLAALESRPPRGLPSWEGTPGTSSSLLYPADGDYDIWLQPFPDDLFPASSTHPRDFDTRESISLELVGALQALAPGRRATLLIRDFTTLPDEEIAGVLGPAFDDSGVDEMRSALRGTYRRREGNRLPPSDGEAATLVMRYIHCWETSDTVGLAKMISDDVVLQAPPARRWLEGAGHAISWLSAGILHGDTKRRWRLLPRRANGQLAFGAFRRECEGRPYNADSIHVVYFSGSSICEIIIFRCPSLFPIFGLLPELVAQGE